MHFVVLCSQEKGGDEAMLQAVVFVTVLVPDRTARYCLDPELSTPTESPKFSWKALSSYLQPPCSLQMHPPSPQSTLISLIL